MNDPAHGVQQRLVGLRCADYQRKKGPGTLIEEKCSGSNAKARSIARLRTAYRKSCSQLVIIFYSSLVAQCHHGIDLRRAARGNVASQQCRKQKHNRDRTKSRKID